MKSFADRSERVLVRRLVAPDVGWDEFYSSSDQHSNPLHQEFLGYSSTVSYRMLTVRGFVEVFDAVAIWAHYFCTV